MAEARARVENNVGRDNLIPVANRNGTNCLALSKDQSAMRSEYAIPGGMKPVCCAETDEDERKVKTIYRCLTKNCDAL